MGEYDKAIQILESISKGLEIGDEKFYDVNNRLSLTYLKAGHLDEAQTHTLKIVELAESHNIKLIDSYQILGRVLSSRMDYTQAEKYFNLALMIAESNKVNPKNKSLFETYRDLAETFFLKKDFDQSIHFFCKAEELIEVLVQKHEYFKLYKSQANLYYSLEEYKKSKHYEDLYYLSLNQYLNIQAKLREADQRINIALITQRYFAEVDKQERADILKIFKLTSGGLFVLLLLVISYHRYRKIRLRNSIEKELVRLKVLDWD